MVTMCLSTAPAHHQGLLHQRNQPGTSAQQDGNVRGRGTGHSDCLLCNARERGALHLFAPLQGRLHPRGWAGPQHTTGGGCEGVEGQQAGS